MRLFSLNTQLSRHDDKLEGFLSREQFDVLTLQEVSQRTLTRFSRIFCGHFEKNFIYEGVEYGVAILVKKGVSMENIRFRQYGGGNGHTKQMYQDKPDCDYYTKGRYGILIGDIHVGGKKMTLSTNYFPVAYPSDQTNPHQIDFMNGLIPLIESESGMIFTGDFNIARSSSENGEPRPQHPLYPRLANILKDNIPPGVNNTLDPKIHRVEGLEVVCDYIWSRGNHRVSNVRLHQGLSDHQGISADISIEE